MIHFVGAGPGAADLITLRGAKAIAQADVIIYAGSLVNPELLEQCKKGCVVHNSAGMTLEEVIAVMRKAEDAGQNLVRLHTGDPSLYGAIKEQMDILDSFSIGYDVVPGVSSFLGAAAALRTEFTLPAVSQTLILTRMEGRTPVPEAESIEKLAKHQASMAIFLSASMLTSLSLKLIEGGYTASTPAAIIFKATWKDEKVIRTTVGKLNEAAQKYNITKTALIFVGEFLGGAYERSKLYDPTFTHGFRQGTNQANNQDNQQGSYQENDQDCQKGTAQANDQDSQQGSCQGNGQDNQQGTAQGIAQDNDQ